MPRGLVRLTGLVFAIAGFVAVHAVFAWAVFWLAGIWFEATVDGPARSGIPAAIITDLGLITVFALQHSGMARRGFKKATGAIVPEGLERTVYVWAAVLALAAIVHLYQPIPAVIWQVENMLVSLILYGLMAAGWALAGAAYLSAGIFYLLGVSQALAWYRGAAQPAPPLVDAQVYALVRNPQQLGLLIAFWSTPLMTAGHLLFSVAMTAFIFLGMRLEQRDLLAMHGQSYADYAKRVPMILPIRRR